MAGDEFTLYLCDYTKKNLEEKFLGKLRYNSINKFSFQNNRFVGNKDKYEMEERMSDGNNLYNIFSIENITKIRNNLLDNPVSPSEKEAYEDTKDIINWIDLVLNKYSNSFFYSENLEEGSMHLLLITDVD
jgi:hypothetical protein